MVLKDTQITTESQSLETKQIPWLWWVGRKRRQRILDGQTGFANSFSLYAVTNILDGDFPFFFQVMSLAMGIYREL